MSAALTGPLWLVGGGKMGSALAAGWIDAGLPVGALAVVEPNPEAREAWAARGALTFANVGALGSPDRPEELPQAVILAVKPQQMADVLAALAGRLPPATAVISIAAGVPIASFAAALGAARPIVRVMPNTPSAVGRGISALVANPAAGADVRALATRLMAAVGETVWLEDEDGMHAVTALSGGGPAYVFWLIETMAAAGVAQGLDPEVAARLALATVAGAGELARRSPEPPAQLRRNVTSPGGTTAEALAVLMAEDGLAPLMDRALEAAAARSRVLAGEVDPA
ncbi:MAG: pyrroline-5-carboxylate reductase [Alphaproteobacteria bacterium]